MENDFLRRDPRLLVALIAEEAKDPTIRHRLDDADVVVEGGNPGCGDTVTVYLKGTGDGHGIADLTFEGEGCNISQAAASMLLKHVKREGLSMDDVLAFKPEMMKEFVGESALATRPRCATLALGVLKEAVRRHRKALRETGRWTGPIDPIQGH